MLTSHFSNTPTPPRHTSSQLCGPPLPLVTHRHKYVGPPIPPRHTSSQMCAPPLRLGAWRRSRICFYNRTLRFHVRREMNVISISVAPQSISADVFNIKFHLEKLKMRRLIIASLI